MSTTISSLTNSAGIILNSYSNKQSGSVTNELTEEQKQKIAKIVADYEAKLITKAEEEQKIAQVKAWVKREKINLKPQKTYPITKSNERELLTPAEKTKLEFIKNLKELIKNRDEGLSSEKDVNDYITGHKNSQIFGEGALIDRRI